MKIRFKKVKAFAILLCSLLAIASFGIGFNGIRGAYAESEAVEIVNPGFEELTGGVGSLPVGWSTWTALNEKDSSLANVNFSTVSGEDAHAGKSLKVVNLSGDSLIRGV